jgi:propanediol dehydratase large subunit
VRPKVIASTATIRRADQQVPSEQFITLMRAMTPNPFGEFIGYNDSEIWQAIEKRRAQLERGEQDDLTDLKGREWEQFAHPASHTPSKDFRLREVAVPGGFATSLKRVVLVERLREVRALIGFTRIDAPGELGSDPQSSGQRRVMRC